MKWLNSSIKNKIAVYFVACSLLACLIIGVISSMVAQKALKESKSENLESIRDSKIIELQKQYETYLKNVNAMSQTKFIQDALVSFESMAYGMGFDISQDADLNSEYYTGLETKYTAVFEEIVQQYGFKNFYIVLNSGTVISQYKTTPFKGQNLINGKLKETKFAGFVRDSLKKPTFLDIYFSDVLNEPAAYIGVPIKSKFDRDGYAKDVIMGALIIHMDWEKINAISKFKTGLGTTGEIYLVNKDRMLSTDTQSKDDKFKYINAVTRKIKIEGNSINKIFASKTTSSWVEEAQNYLGENVLSAFAQFELADMPYGIFVEMTTNEVFASVNRIRAITFGLIFVFGIILAFTGWYIGSSISAPIQKMAEAATKIAEGEMIQIENITQKDEIGQCMHAMNNMVTVLKSVNTDLEKITHAAIEGKLKERLSVDKYQGDYRKIIAGINHILDEIMKPVNEAVVILQKVANGDLAIKMEGDYKGDHAVIKEAINRTVTSLGAILKNVRLAVMQVDSSSKDISKNSANLSNGATQQASAIEQITTSMTEIGRQAVENAQNASQAQSLSTEVKSSAVEGNDHMSKMLKAMSEINDSSYNISKIIKVIDEIAFQTNLLALNAAVEAARAGSHGKGFAVVAEEVRNLAGRSAEAAKETTVLIEDSKIKVQHGSEIAKNTAGALGQIVNGIGKVTEIISEIATASKEQAAGVSQVNSGLTQVDEVTKRNTSFSGEASHSSSDLINQAVTLSKMIAQFRLDDSQPGVNSSIENVVKFEQKAQGNQLSVAVGAEDLSSTQNKNDKYFGRF